MPDWSPEFAKKLIEAHRMNEPRPLCPPPCHGPILVAAGGEDADAVLTCSKCGASATVQKPAPA